MKMKGKEGIQGIPEKEIIEEQEITKVDREVPAGRIDTETTNKEVEIEAFPKTREIPHPQEITTKKELTTNKEINHPHETIKSLMTDLDMTAVVTLGHLETEENHHVPFQGTETDQEIGDIVNMIIHDLTPEDVIGGTEIKDLTLEDEIEDPDITDLRVGTIIGGTEIKGLQAETIIEDEEITENTRLGLNHLQLMVIDPPVKPELQKNLS